MSKVSLCLTGALSVGLFAQQTNTPSHRVAAASQSHPEMQNSKAKLSREVGALLNSTNRARTEIARKDQQQAAKDVEEALSRANHILNAPGGSDLVPLYTELIRTSVITPVMQERRSAAARARGQRSSNRSGAGSGSEANQSADRMTSTGTKAHAPDEVVNEVVGDYTSVLLDVPATQKHLRAAQKALANHDLASADRDLKAVQDSVVVSSLDADMPLLRARENLVLARDSAMNSKYADAQKQLQAACQALSLYEKNSSSHRQDAERLRSEVSSYEQSLTSNHADAASKIESWWEQTTGWITPARRSSADTGE